MNALNLSCDGSKSFLIIFTFFELQTDKRFFSTFLFEFHERGYRSKCSYVMLIRNDNNYWFNDKDLTMNFGYRKFMTVSMFRSFACYGTIFIT